MAAFLGMLEDAMFPGPLTLAAGDRGRRQQGVSIRTRRHDGPGLADDEQPEAPMAYDEDLVQMIRAAVAAAAGPADHREIEMFGGLCWTVNTYMAVGAGDDDRMVHVGKDGVAEALGRGARPATMGERTMGGVVLVAAADLPDTDALDAWVGPAVERARAKPPKKPKA